MTSFSGDYPIESDAFIAKNYLSRDELDTLNRLVSLYLDFAELQAKEEKVMTMADWANELDYFLKMTRKDILSGKGRVSHEKAIEHAKEEYGKFKNRFLDNPTENERVYIARMHQLFVVEKKGK